MALGLGRKALHHIDDREAAEDRRQDHPVPEPARPFEDVGVIGELENPLNIALWMSPMSVRSADRAHAGHDPDPQSEQAEDEQADPSVVLRPRVGGRGRSGGIGRG